MNDRRRESRKEAEHRISRWVDRMAAGASRNPAAPRNAVSPWEAGAPRSAASRWEIAANPWLGAIAVLAYWKFESISLQRRVARTSVRESDEVLWLRQSFEACRDIDAAAKDVTVLDDDGSPRSSKTRSSLPAASSCTRAETQTSRSTFDPIVDDASILPR
jgi:hypothetical protein